MEHIALGLIVCDFAENPGADAHGFQRLVLQLPGVGTGRTQDKIIFLQASGLRKGRSVSPWSTFRRLCPVFRKKTFLVGPGRRMLGRYGQKGLAVG